MERRYKHFLRSIKGAKAPTLILAVEPVGQVDEARSRPGCRIETLHYWSASSWKRTGQSSGDVRHYSGQTDSELWRIIYRRMRGGDATWVISMYALRAWALLGVWERLESGELYLVGRRRPTKGGASADGSPSEVGYMVTEDPPTILTCRTAGKPGALTWVDARNYGLADWQSVESAYGVALTAPTGGIGERDWRAEEAERRSAALCSMAAEMVRSVDELKMGGLKTTAGAQAFAALKCSHLHHSVWVHTDSEALALERDSYHGGRAEPFRVGSYRGQFRCYDISSMYPALCAKLNLPARLVGVEHSPSPQRVAELRSAYSTIESVSVRTAAPCLPCWVGGQTRYPVGQFGATLCGPELALAQRHAEILSVRTVCYYESEPWLQSYASALLCERTKAASAGNRVRESYIKRLLVAVVGKIGQRRRGWELMPGTPAPEPYCEWHHELPDGTLERRRSIAWNAYRQFDGGEGPESILSAASWIVSAGRALLWSIMLAAGSEHVYYCDTDSVIVDMEGARRIEDSEYYRPGEYGYLRMVREFGDLEIRGTKNYVWDGTPVCAGLAKGGPERIDGEGAEWRSEWMARAVKEGRRPSATSYRVGLHERMRENLGEIGPDGWILPLVRDEI